MPPGSFGIFETFRILIPGYFAALYSGWYLTLFWPSAAEYLANSKLATATFFGFGLLAGFLLYLQKMPSDPRKVKDLLPSQAILEKASKLSHPMDFGQATNLYFYLLNNYIPDAMRERIYFYGNIYRVGQKTWLLSIVFGLLGLLTAAAKCIAGQGPPRAGPASAYFAILIGTFAVAYLRAPSRYIEILRGQRQWLEMRRALVESLIREGYDSHFNP